MTPEEFDRREDFITESLARLTTAQEQDRQNRVESEKWARTMLDSMKQTDEQIAATNKRLSVLFERQTELLAHQSDRIDRMDAMYSQIVHLLNLILDRLPPLAGNQT
jgi:hypothetical protein